MDNKSSCRTCECFTTWKTETKLAIDISEITNCLVEIDLFSWALCTFVKWWSVNYGNNRLANAIEQRSAICSRNVLLKHSQRGASQITSTRLSLRMIYQCLNISDNVLTGGLADLMIHLGNWGHLNDRRVTNQQITTRRFDGVQNPRSRILFVFLWSWNTLITCIFHSYR